MHLKILFAKWQPFCSGGDGLKGFKQSHSNNYFWHLLISVNPGLILGLCPANERRRYFVTMSLIGWVQAQNQPCNLRSMAHQYESCYESYDIDVNDVARRGEINITTATEVYTTDLFHKPFMRSLSKSCLNMYCSHMRNDRDNDKKSGHNFAHVPIAELWD